MGKRPYTVPFLSKPCRNYFIPIIVLTFIVSGNTMSDEETKVKEFGKHIIHIEDLKPNEFLAFLKAWNLDKHNIVITEKMDGFFLAFGLESNSFYLQTKHSKWTSSEQIADVYFLQSMKRYFTLLENIPIGSILTPYGYKNGDFVRFSGEAIPSYDHNIVMYDEKHIGDGAFIIYQITIGQNQITDANTISEIAGKMQSASQVKFKGNPKVSHLQNIKIPNKVIVDIENYIKTHGNVLSKPARTDEAKQVKAKIVELIKGLGTKIKSKFLAVPYEPAFGGDYEGYVIHLPDGNMVKIVDKDKFTASKEANWLFINQYSNASDTLIRKLKNKEMGLKEAIVWFESELDKIDKEFNANRGIFTIGKKIRDTEENGKRMRKILAKLKDLASKGVEAEQVVDMSKNRQLDEGLLLEGGNAIKQANSLVPKQYLEPTVQNAIKKLGLQAAKYDIVGNKSKEFLGDIDVAISPESIVKLYKINSENFWEELQQKLSTSPLPSAVIKGLRQFHVGVPVVDQQGNQIKAVDPETKKETNEPAICQIDFMVGNRDWMRNVLSGALESKYKAALRNILLGAMVKNIPAPVPNGKYMFTLRDGLQFVTYDDLNAKKPIEKNRKTVASNGDQLVGKLFDGLTWNDVDNFEKLWAAFLSDKNKYKDNKQAVFSDFKRLAMGAKFPLPQETESLQEETNMANSGKKVGLYAGSFKPFHAGHMAALELAASKSDKLTIFFSMSDRDNLTGPRAVEYFKKFIMPVVKTLGKPVDVKFVKIPVRSVFETLEAADKDESNNDTYILFADETDFQKRYTDKDLKRYVPKLVEQGRVKGVYTPRVASGTAAREALDSGNLEALRKLLPRQIQSQAQEIMDFLRAPTEQNKDMAMNKKQLAEAKLATYEMNGMLQEKAPPGYEGQVEQFKKMLMLKGFDEERATNIAMGKAWNAYETKQPLLEMEHQDDYNPFQAGPGNMKKVNKGTYQGFIAALNGEKKNLMKTHREDYAKDVIGVFDSLIEFLKQTFEGGEAPVLEEGKEKWTPPWLKGKDKDKKEGDKEDDKDSKKPEAKSDDKPKDSKKDLKKFFEGAAADFANEQYQAPPPKESKSEKEAKKHGNPDLTPRQEKNDDKKDAAREAADRKKRQDAIKKQNRGKPSSFDKPKKK